VTKAPTILFCVGATKAGTSWLYDFLAGHPGAHLRAIKELHYFDTLESGGFRRQIVVQDRFAARIRGRISAVEGEALARATQKLQDVLDWQAVLALESEDTARYLAYLTGGQISQSLVADITPAYALLPHDRLHAMARLSPDVRFVYLMRDPVARLWSHVRMIVRRAGEVSERLAAACAAILDKALAGQEAGITERGDYAAALTRLNAAVAPEKLLVMCMETMLTPAGLARLCQFLGLEAREADFDAPTHVSPALAMTLDQKHRAAAYLRPQYDFVARHYPDLPANWRKNMGEAL
jgi:hypothetical protein